MFLITGFLLVKLIKEVKWKSVVKTWKNNTFPFEPTCFTFYIKGERFYFISKPDINLFVFTKYLFELQFYSFLNC